MICLSNAELAVLEKIYPEGCRVELEYLGPDPYSKLTPGDLGTVKYIDDAGQIHVSWDKGGSLALVYKEDKCKCIMTKEQMQKDLDTFKKMPFENLDKMQEWLEDKLLPVFPRMEIRPALNNEMLIDLGHEAFQMQKPKIPIQFSQDAQKHVYVKEYEMREGKAVAMRKSSR